MINTLKVKTGNMEQATRQGYILATDLADYLVKKGESFRTAHDIVTKLVRYAIEKEKSFGELSLDEYREFSPSFGEDVYSITVESSIAARNTTGGTAPEQVAEALSRARDIIGGNKDERHGKHDETGPETAG